MRKKLIEKIKPEVLQAVRNHSFESKEFEKKEYNWFLHNEKLNEIYNKVAFRRILALLSRGITSNISQSAKNHFFIDTIAYLTSDMSYFKKLLFLKYVKNGNIIQRYRRTKKGYIIVDEEGREVNIDLISRFKNITKIFPEITDFTKRTGKCHSNSMLLSQFWNNKDVYVVTGNVSDIRETHKYTHSWIELTAENGNKAVIDFNLNAIFKKEDFYRLYSAEPLSYVSQDKMRDFLKKGYCERGGYLHGINPKFLLLYFDDIMEIVEGLPEDERNKYKNTAEPTQMGG